MSFTKRFYIDFAVGEKEKLTKSASVLAYSEKNAIAFIKNKNPNFSHIINVEEVNSDDLKQLNK